MIEWYEHPDDEHTVHHVYYSHRMPGENWYGFSPPEEPEPTMWCEWCGEPISNDDTVRGGDAVCEDCAEYWDSNNAACDFIIKFFGSMPDLAARCRWDPWMDEFAEYMRECEPDLLKQVMKKEETPCGNTTSQD